MNDEAFRELYGMVKEMYGQFVKSGFMDDVKQKLDGYDEAIRERADTCPYKGINARKERHWWLAIVISNICGLVIGSVSVWLQKIITGGS